MLTAHRGMHLVIVLVEEVHEEISNCILKMQFDLRKYLSIIRRWERFLLLSFNSDFRGRRVRWFSGRTRREERSAVFKR